MTVEPFTVTIDPDALADLAARLGRTRWPGDFANDDWRYGTNEAYLRELVDYWREHYDWTAHERRMNTFRHFRTTIDGVPIHFIHERGRGPRPIPLILTHGWPWTFWDYEKVIGPLTDPAAHGGDARDSFDVVIPSLPGFGFSTPLTVAGIPHWRTADLWVTLMRDELGYDTFAAQGGDYGAAVAAQLGHKYAEHVLGIHIHTILPLQFWAGLDDPSMNIYSGANGGPSPDDYTPVEREMLARSFAFFKEEAGFVEIQSTKPQSLAYAMNDSPAGLCAWLVEKRRAWSDCDGDVERRFSKDDLCTTATLYWMTNSFGTSARYYWEARHRLWAPSHDRSPIVEAPTAIALFLRDTVAMPRQWCERYYNLERWTTIPVGGHFAPAEEPELLVEDIRSFFRGHR